MIRARRRAAAAVATATVIGGLLAGVGTAQAATTTAPPAATTAGLPAAQQALWKSTTTATAIVDPTTNAILSVTAGAPRAGMQPAISHQTHCDTGWACLYSQVPYANQGFYGSPGQINSSWPSVWKIYSGIYTAGFYYFPPNSFSEQQLVLLPNKFVQFCCGDTVRVVAVAIQ